MTESRSNANLTSVFDRHFSRWNRAKYVKSKTTRVLRSNDCAMSTKFDVIRSKSLYVSVSRYWASWKTDENRHENVINIITHPTIVRSRWNLTCWCLLVPGRRGIVRIHIRSNPRWRTAPHSNVLIAITSPRIVPILLLVPILITTQLRIKVAGLTFKVTVWRNVSTVKTLYARNW